jgi:hypothetical protein
MAQDRLERARQLYERAVFGGEAAALGTAERELDQVEADLALARGRILHARCLAANRDDPHELALFERAVELYRQLGDARGEAEALLWVGTYLQVVRRDQAAALAPLERACALALQLDDRLLRSYAARHLGFAAQSDGHLERAEQLHTESVSLRRELGFRPGVAAGLLALAELAAQAGDRQRAYDLLDEAQAEALASEAHGILHWIEAARAELAAGRNP